MKSTANIFNLILPPLLGRRATLALALLALLSTLNHPLSTLHAQGTAFTYQGQLTDSGSPANGSYDLTFALFNASTAGSQAGTTITNTSLGVTNGLFTVLLDFGNQFNSTPYWLQIGVRTSGGGAFTALTPRQALTPAPYSIFASNTALLNGQGPSAFAPASGSTAYVAKSGDTMTGTLNLPANGLVAGGSQLVLSGGKVGIGTANPVEKMDVKTGTDRHFVVQAPQILADGVAFASVNDADTQNKGLEMRGSTVQLTTIGANPMLFAVNYTERMRVDTNGNVGIGTASPATKFEVQGGPIKATGGLIIETRNGSDPPSPVTGQIWLRTDL